MRLIQLILSLNGLCSCVDAHLQIWLPYIRTEYIYMRWWCCRIYVYAAEMLLRKPFWSACMSHMNIGRRASPHPRTNGHRCQKPSPSQLRRTIPFGAGCWRLLLLLAVHKVYVCYRHLSHYRLWRKTEIRVRFSTLKENRVGSTATVVFK